MPYVPINTPAYTAAYAGAITGMAVSGWITNAASTDYTDVTAIAGAFAQAFDLTWNNAAQLNNLELACMTSVVQQDFNGRGPGPFDNTLFKDPANWNIAARACVALILECDIFFAIEGIVPEIPATNYATAWLVPDWYIDGTIGDNANDGTSALTPLQTGTELLRRLGPYAIWPQSVTVHILANGMLPADALVLRGLMQNVGDHLDIIGTPTILATDVVSAYTARNHSTPIGNQIAGTAIADWTPYRWCRVRNTTGARLDNIVWVATENPNGVGVNTARVSAPGMLNLTSNTAIFVSSTSWVVGDTFTVEVLPFVPEMTIAVDGPLWCTGGTTPLYDRRQVMVRDIDVPFLLIASASSLGHNGTIIFGNKLSQWSFGIPPTSSTALSTVFSCHVHEMNPTTPLGNKLLTNSSSNCLYGSGFAASLVVNTIALSNGLFQGVSLSSSSFPTNVTNTQIFDVTTTATTVAATFKMGRVQNLSGNGNIGYGLGLVNGSQITLAGTINLLGAVANARLVSATAISLTYPRLLQPDDYAQHGVTPAMVAGTTTVTVPWYLNTSQRVTVSYNTFGGTPGSLSVQQTSTTQFIITSSSATDTSTVNWSISPLGKNVFVSTV